MFGLENILEENGKLICENGDVLLWTDDDYIPYLNDEEANTDDVELFLIDNFTEKEAKKYAESVNVRIDYDVSLFDADLLDRLCDRARWDDKIGYWIKPDGKIISVLDRGAEFRQVQGRLEVEDLKLIYNSNSQYYNIDKHYFEDVLRRTKMSSEEIESLIKEFYENKGE